MTSAEIDPHVLMIDDRKLGGDIGYRTGLEGHRVAANRYAALIRFLSFVQIILQDSTARPLQRRRASEELSRCGA